MSNFWKDKKVFITGLTGLIGKYLAKELLNLDAQVTGLLYDEINTTLFDSLEIDHRKIGWKRGDLRDFSNLRRIMAEITPEFVFHLGAQALVGVGHLDPKYTFETNVQGTWNLLEAEQYLGRFGMPYTIVASSDKAYDPNNTCPYHEGQRLQGKEPYELSKSCADMIAQMYGNYSDNVTIARCGNIFGGGDLNFSRIIPHVIKSIYTDTSVLLRSDGKLIRDYFYVKQAVSGYLTLAEEMTKQSLGGEVFNFGSGKGYFVNNIINIVASVMGKIPKIVYPENPVTDEIPVQYLDCSKAKNVLGWKYTGNLKDDLKTTVDWYIKWFDMHKIK